MSASPAGTLIIRNLGELDYVPVWQRMQAFTVDRDDKTLDELWLLSHPPVFTQGQAGKAEHLLDTGSIPVVQIDRGGQATYHGPGQLVVYLLLDLRRAGLGIRALVDMLEQAVIAVLEQLGICAQTRAKAPGVYVNDAKIAALGLRVKQGRSYHGLSVNIDMDLAPFLRINPCGYKGLRSTTVLLELQRQGKVVANLWSVVQGLLEAELVRRAGYSTFLKQTGFNQ
ncbi:MAG: lipoyl(octanoyl) transferase LipB [Pseudomonadales bacterium]|nr:lipoyl(octanoyl) transferase LipB [Pseudomonadales bacterium]